MRNLILASLLLAFSVFTVNADFPVNYEMDVSVVEVMAVADTNVMILISYDGSAASATIDLNGNAIELHSGDTIGSEDNAYSGEDVNGANGCGTTNGALDLTAGTCVTYAGFVDTINDAHDSGYTDFHAVLVGAVGTETTTVNEFGDPADAQVKIPEGYGILMDVSDVDNYTFTLTPWAQKKVKADISPWLDGAGEPRNPAPTRQVSRLSHVTAMQDGTGSGTLKLYYCVYAGGGDGSPTQTLVYSAAAADTTVYNLDLTQTPFTGTGGFWMVQLNYGADATAGYLMAVGDFGRYK